MVEETTSIKKPINYAINYEGFAQQGWQCPVCGAVMAPWCSSCINCTGHKNVTIGTGSTPGYPYPMFPQTICKVEGKKIDGTATF